MVLGTYSKPFGDSNMHTGSIQFFSASNESAESKNKIRVWSNIFLKGDTGKVEAQAPSRSDGQMLFIGV